MTNPANSQIRNQNQLETGICAIIYKQNTKPNNGMRDRLCLNAKTANTKLVIQKSKIGA